MQMINELKLKEVFKNCTNVNKCNKKKMFSNVTELLVIIPPGDVWINLLSVEGKKVGVECNDRHS